jgi:hypothetical protein
VGGGREPVSSRQVAFILLALTATIAAGYGLAGAGFSPGSSLNMRDLVLSLFIVALLVRPVTTLLHELGHAIAAIRLADRPASSLPEVSPLHAGLVRFVMTAAMNSAPSFMVMSTRGGRDPNSSMVAMSSSRKLRTTPKPASGLKSMLVSVNVSLPPSRESRPSTECRGLKGKPAPQLQRVWLPETSPLIAVAPSSHQAHRHSPNAPRPDRRDPTDRHTPEKSPPRSTPRNRSKPQSAVLSAVTSEL